MPDRVSRPAGDVSIQFHPLDEMKIVSVAEDMDERLSIGEINKFLGKRLSVAQLQEEIKKLREDS
jgi:hypothetical protein